MGAVKDLLLRLFWGEWCNKYTPERLRFAIWNWLRGADLKPEALSGVTEPKFGGKYGDSTTDGNISWTNRQEPQVGTVSRRKPHENKRNIEE